MKSIRHTKLYAEVIKELNYSFGDVFILDGYVISEFKEGEVITWENHAKLMTEDVSSFLGTFGNDLRYISHRIHSYTVVAADWSKFYKNSYSLNGYAVVSYNNKNLNFLFESLFFALKIKRFSNLEDAIDWAKQSNFVVQKK